MYIKKRGKAKLAKDAAAAPEESAASASAASAAAPGGGGGGGKAASNSVMTNEDDFDHRLGNYQLMEGIGKGGYGTVYRGLNIMSGQTVAVKRVNLQGIPMEELESIEMEIKLLQNLAHPNIVKYLDSIRTAEHLNIILEFVENGSLSSLLVKFGGQFPEQLCSHYITQVLKGLHYLHTQGVIHRDIKGANILSTKEGQVKLADFGVATKLNESRKSDSVVGTPYWMAPEIIEMTGQQSSACDIWSVGCTCLELLTGKPPYFDLQQMPALFRIVQDEHPPLPDGISPALEDFLMQTFQKDPNRRIDALGLLKHPWLRKSVEAQEVEEIQRKMASDLLGGGGPKAGAAAQGHESDSEEDDGRKPASKLPKSAKKPASAAAKGGKGSDDEDWDGDDEPLANLAAAAHKAHPSTAAFPKDFARTIAPGKKTPSNAANAAKSPHSTDAELSLKPRAPVDENEDVFGDFSEDEEEEVLDKTSMKTIAPSVAAKPAVASKTNSVSSKSPKPAGHAHSHAGAGGASPIKSTSTDLGSGGGGAFMLSSTSGQSASSPRKLDSFVENDEDELGEYTELEADFEVRQPVVAAVPAKGAGAKGTAAAGAAKTAGGGKSAPLAFAKPSTSLPDDLDGLDDADEEADPFDDVGFEDEDDPSSGQGAEDVLLTRAFMRVIEALSPLNDERVILDACEKLNEMGSKNPDTIRALMTSHGVIPIMEMLEVNNQHVLHAVLKVINQIVGKNIKFQQSMSLVGLIPAIIRFGGANYPTEIRMESASFVRQFCYASDWTRKMFIACDGLPVLVSFLLEDYHHSKTLVWNAIDCIRHVFDITTNPKNDFCRLFCKFGLLEPLSKTLIDIQADKESADAPDYVLKIAKILHLFSQGDKVVKNHFAKPSVIESMLRVLPSLPQDILILLLKSIRNISMDSTTLDLLESAGAIPALIPFLDQSQVSENQHQVLQTMYYLCQIKSSRQEQAALSGIIPHLQRFIRLDHPLKQFAYPIIFLLAKTSWRSRCELKKHGGLQFYIDILTSSDVYWRSYALEIISFWVSCSSEETARVSFLLHTTSNINKLLRVFRETSDDAQFDKMLPSIRKILATSVKVNQSLGRGKEFMREIRHRLERHSRNNIICINLLKIISLLFAAHPNPSQLAADADLVPVLHRLLEDKSAVIVGSLTQKLLTQYLGEAPRQ